VTYVAAVIGDLEHFVGEIFNLPCPRQSVPAAKFLIASEPAAYRGFRRHPGVRTDGPKAFTVDEPEADRLSNLSIITGRTAALGRVVGVHGGYRGSWLPHPFDNPARPSHRKRGLTAKARGRLGPDVIASRLARSHDARARACPGRGLNMSRVQLA
jgi:hypothetical protein